MTRFEYSTPSTIAEAVAQLSQAGAIALAGGTDLMVHIRAGVKSPETVVDLSALGLNYVRREDSFIAIGAMTTFAELLESEIVRRDLTCLAEAAAEIGAVQTRNMATVGGNLCSAVPSADSAPALLVLDARVRIAGRSGERLVDLERFFVGPKKCALQSGEILQEIQVPVPSERTGMRFLKVGRRKALTLAVVNAAVLLSLEPDGQHVERARIALGAVAPVPLRALRAESMMQGCVPNAELIEEVACRAAEESAPISDLRASAFYRRDVSRVLVQRALTYAWDRARDDA